MKTEPSKILEGVNPSWVGVILAVISIFVAILLKMAGLEWISPTFAITGMIIIIPMPVVLFFYWKHRQKTKDRSFTAATPLLPQPTGRVLVEIHGDGVAYEQEFQIDGKARVLLRPESGTQSRTLRGILHTILDPSPENLEHFDAAFQMDVGEYLLKTIFPDSAEKPLPPHAEVFLHTRQPGLLLLPWHLLSQGDIFLSSFLELTVSVSGLPPENRGREPCRLPDEPKVLLVLPESAPDAGAHGEALENELSARNHTLIRGRNLRIAETWKTFTAALARFSPDVVYCYGAGSPEGIVLEGGRTVGAGMLADAVERMSRRPVLIYLNAVGGGAGIVDFGLALEKWVPAVISSRFVTNADSADADSAIAREQGLKLLIDIVTRAAAPHGAVAGLFGRLESPKDTNRARWLTPLLFRHYSEWRAKVPETPARAIHDPHWHLKIDRVSQFSTVAAQTLQMVREGRPRCQAFVWYGTEGQGVKLFHQRLYVELREYLLNFNATLHEVRPEWPMEGVDTDDPGMAFRDCLCDAFGVGNLDDIPIAIRGLTQGAAGKQTLVAVRHVPVDSRRVMNPKTLKAYLTWWDRAFMPILKRERGQFVLLGISFIVRNPPKFRELVLEKERIEDLRLKHTVFRLLDEMERLAERDIADFFKTHNIHLPIRNRDAIIRRTLEKTGGHYEKTVGELRRLVNESWDLGEEEGRDGDVAGEDEEY
uniref:Uncharacterized protein n=1 Tax=Candidatus Kentrum sp. FM TaxID=2126340 RepID=A0A450VZI4_9GAMM|nr:MAG: hypothetical protein BECKFM1743A_GA0114220_100183 [Candidatus Kentron sp. FM]VFJ54178.1 MAG: hypothetical protein BECKFM1743C_GA0114222_101353 [Candidatus Kentron sp. FM]VFK10182.1 MAG: hypothetical protein BECKFM1743B_GA0114221_101323 [Candidatus Kentron sp. FM]